MEPNNWIASSRSLGDLIIADAGPLIALGTVAVLLAARRQHLVPAIAPLLQTLRDRGYFLSDGLVAVAFARAGES